MPITPKQQADFQNKLLQEWAAEVLSVLQDKLRAASGYVPTDTFNNLKVQVLKAAANNPETNFFLQFQDSGRIVDMRRVQYRNRAISQEKNFILEWVRKRGLEKFKFVPGYSDKNRVQLSREKQEERIASAIIASKASNVRTRRQPRKRRWFNKTFYSLVEELVVDLLNRQGEIVLEQTVQDIEEAFNQN